MIINYRTPQYNLYYKVDRLFGVRITVKIPKT